MKAYTRVLLVGLVLLLIAGVSAAQSATLILTEAAINSSFLVTSPPRMTVSSVSVDLQPGQAVITSTVTPRRGGDVIVYVATVTPVIEDGAVRWDLISLTANGQDASGSQAAAVRSALLNAWHRFMRAALGSDLLSITTSDTDITYTFDSRRITTTTTVNPVTITVTITEAEANAVIADTALWENVRVDFATGTVTISGQWVGTRPATTASLRVAPVVAQCQVTWEVQEASVTVINRRATDTTMLIEQLTTMWRGYWSMQDGRACISAVTVTDSALSYTTR